MNTLFHRYLTVLTAILLTAIGASAYDFEVDGIYYTIVPDGVEVYDTSYIPANVTIPAKVTIDSVEYDVVGVGDRAFFQHWGLISITFEGPLKYIEHAAFFDCRYLKNLPDMPEVTRIGSGAFEGCISITNLSASSIPKVTTIGGDAFQGCTSLTTVELPETLTHIGYGAFAGCSSLTSITLPDNLSFWGSGIFRDCTALTSITVPGNIEKLDFDTFGGCTALKECIFTGSVKEIESRCFTNCKSLTRVVLPEGLEKLSSSLFKNLPVQEIHLPSSLTTIGSGALKNTQISEINLPSSLTTIGSEALANTQISEINLPPSLVSIGSYAFENTLLNEINIPPSVRIIGSEAFAGTQISDIYIPPTVTWLGEDICLNCKSLTSATLECELEMNNCMRDPQSDRYSWVMFSENDNLETVRVGGNIANLQAGFFQNVKIRNLYLGLNLQVIANCAFIGTEIENIYFPSPYPPKFYGRYNRYHVVDHVIAHIPKGSMEAYLNSELSPNNKFRIFINITFIDDLEMPSESSIDGSVMDNDVEISVVGGRIIAEGIVEVYDGYGRLVGRGLADDLPTLTSGLYIVRTPASAKKIFVR